MPITGSDQAPLFAQFGVMRFGATRFGYHSGHAFISLGGVQVGVGYTGAGRVLIDSLTITDVLDETPNTAQLTVFGAAPALDDEIIVSLGSMNGGRRMFAGHVLNVEQFYVGKPANVQWQVSAVDYTWLLGFRKVTTRYTNQSATTIAQDLITTYAAVNGFTSANVVDGLDVVDEITFTDEELPQALTRLAARIGAYWYVDYFKDLHFFLTDTGQNPADLTPTHSSLSDFVYGRSGSQRTNRVTCEGGGSTAGDDVLVGATILPLEDATFYNTAGGVVRSGPQDLTYTGLTAVLQTGSVVETYIPGSAPTLSNSSTGGGGMTVGAQYRVGITFVAASGESRLSPVSAVTAVTDGVGGSKLMNLTSVPLGPAGTTMRHIYRTEGDGLTFYRTTYTIPDNVTTTVTDQIGQGDAHLVANGSPPPFPQGPDVAVGATSVQVMDIAQFLAAGGIAVVANQTLSYTGRSAASGIGSLTGIPASGVGSIVAPIPSGSPISNLPALKGIPASGAGSVRYAIPKGQDVNLRVTVNDTAAQTALAASLGGDGVREETLQDRRLSETEATARAQATLDKRATEDESISYRCRDLNTASGKTITVNLTAPTNVAGAFKIQQVQISNFRPYADQMPTFTVEASDVRYSFEDLLRQRRSGA